MVSHGELLPGAYDEKLEADPADLRMIFQGVLDEDRQGGSYGQIPRRLGVPEPRSEWGISLASLPAKKDQPK